MFIPESIRRMIAGEDGKTDEIGMSDAAVFFYGDKILKVQPCSAEAENECRMMRYLHGKLPVPDVYVYEEAEGKAYLLMSKCRGRMACDDEYMLAPAVLCSFLAESLKMLWSVNIADCPSDQRLFHKLAQAEYNIKNGLVDLDNVEPDTFGENGFRDPSELLAWLYDHMPEEEPVLSHGDFCLPNVFGVRDQVTGYIDLGRTGIADKWCDIALCYRSLSHNYSGKYAHTAQTYAGFDAAQLFRELGIEPDLDKLRYYILLDELF